MRILAAGARDPERVVAEGPDVDAIIEDFGLGEDDVRFPEEIVLAAEQEFPYAGARSLEALRSSEELEKSLISTWLWLATRLRRSATASAVTLAGIRSPCAAARRTASALAARRTAAAASTGSGVGVARARMARTPVACGATGMCLAARGTATGRTAIQRSAVR